MSITHLGPKHYRYRARILNMDGKVDSSNEAFEPGSAYFEANSSIPIQLGFKADLERTLGYATLEPVLGPDGKCVAMDAVLDFRLPVGCTIEDFAKEYTPSVGGVAIEWRSDWPGPGARSYTRAALTRVGMCISKNCDYTIKTLAETATRLDDPNEIP